MQIKTTMRYLLPQTTENDPYQKDHKCWRKKEPLCSVGGKAYKENGVKVPQNIINRSTI